MAGITHGTITGYQSWFCRCAACKAAQRIYARNYRAAARQRVAADPSLIDEHATLTSYQKGCRCPDCTSANARASRAYRAGRRAALTRDAVL